MMGPISDTITLKEEIKDLETLRESMKTEDPSFSDSHIFNNAFLEKTKLAFSF
jgi:hypothetical protein